VTAARLRQLFFELLYARHADPWQYETSPSERAKYERTLAALGGRRFGRALEVGCSIGVFTDLLAPRCDELLAVDVSRLAVRRARERLAGEPHVRVERARIPAGMPAGPFDLIVCSEVLYYLTRGQAVDAIARIRAALAPGGSVLAVHRREQGRSTPISGEEVHDLLAEHLGAAPVLQNSTPLYRLERFDP
jgi:predicted TPR repeat methyltransferase